jgi:uncharacterized membrane protein
MKKIKSSYVIVYCLLLVLYFLCYFILEDNTDQNFLYIDAVVIVIISISMLFNWQYKNVLIISGFVFVFSSPFDLYEGITANKIDYMLGCNLIEHFNYNRLFFITIICSILILLFTVLSLINKKEA